MEKTLAAKIDLIIMMPPKKILSRPNQKIQTVVRAGIMIYKKKSCNIKEKTFLMLHRCICSSAIYFKNDCGE
jgi:hypothetical protein